VRSRSPRITRSQAWRIVQIRAKSRETLVMRRYRYRSPMHSMIPVSATDSGIARCESTHKPSLRELDAIQACTYLRGVSFSRVSRICDAQMRLLV